VSGDPASPWAGCRAASLTASGLRLSDRLLKIQRSRTGRRASDHAPASLFEMSGFPLPPDGSNPFDDPRRSSVVCVPAPAPGPGNWVGAPSAQEDDNGGFWIAYRVRTADQRGSGVVVAHSEDGERLTPVNTLDKDAFGAASLERPALVRTDNDRWRIYVSCATPGSKHWRIDVLEADEPAALADAEPVTAFPGDDLTGVKDPVVRRTPHGWEAWVCCHPLDLPGEEDRMFTRYATSGDGLTWRWGDAALTGRPRHWDARGARVTAVLPDGRAAYDGRATASENFSERTGLALPGDAPGRLVAEGDVPVRGFRYLDVVPLRRAGYRLYFEAPLPDGSHELRTFHVPPAAD